MQTLNLENLTPFYPALDETKLANVSLRLKDSRRLLTNQQRRRMIQLDRAAKAAASLQSLPARGEAIHCVLKGDFALWHFVPAVVEIAGQAIDELTIATLGFSKDNVEAIDQMLTKGQVKRVGGIVCSHYFAAASIDGPIYQHAAEVAAKHKFPLCAMRNHAKLLLMAVGKRRLVVESSANLRSCHNTETATMFDDGNLYEFHADWIGELLKQGAH